MKKGKTLKVLIALDYDKTAKKVAESGYALAIDLNAEVTLLHIMSDPLNYASTEFAPLTGLTDSLGVDPLQFESNNRLKKVSQHFLDTMKLHLGDANVKTVLEEGDFADTILLKAKNMQANLLVIGSHSHRWLEDIVLGSVTAKVMRNTPIPLYIVPTKKRN